MADADEDVVRHPPTALSSNHALPEFADGSDEEDAVQDYPAFATASHSLDLSQLESFLALDSDVQTPLPSKSAALSSSSALPRRGLKDFEPHETNAQARALEASRDAMHTALSYPRIHGPRNRVIGVYDEQTGHVIVRKRRGIWLSSTGRDLPGGGVELLPEEALWALEGGRLDIRYPSSLLQSEVAINEQPQGEVDAQQDHDEKLLPMSLQAAFALFLGSEPGSPSQPALTMEKYIVYAGLKRSGFIVTRAEGFSSTKRLRSSISTKTKEVHEARLKESQASTSPFAWLYWIASGRSAQNADRERRAIGPLVKPGIYRSYQDIYRALQLISAPLPSEPSATPPAQNQTLEEGDSSTTVYTTTYNIYTASQPYRKTKPPTPAFRVCVVPARTTRFPTLDEIDGLLAEQPPEAHVQRGAKHNWPQSAAASAPKSSRTIGQTYAALKRGQCSVLLAVVDESITSYLRVNEAGFVSEGRLFERDAASDRQRKGTGRGRGRGRGRGGKRGG